MARAENSARNVKTAWILQLVHILCQFFSRTVIIRILGIEYSGLSGLFGNVLMMLSLAELGVGEAIIFSLYGPIARDEKDTIKSIMAFFKKVYICVGAAVTVVGLALTPFIDFFIKDEPDIDHLKIIYMLYVVNTAASYFFSYKASYITANQNNYLVVLNNGLFELARVLLQALVLLLTKSYIAFMVVSVVTVVLQNLNIARVADKRYPYLRDRDAGRMPEEISREIKKNTLAMVFHKIGSIMVFATDNLIISKFLGLAAVGFYANYTLIADAVTSTINKFFSAIAASIGNLAATEGVEKQEKILYRVLFMDFWLYTFSCCCLANLMSPFIRIWLGADFVQSEIMVILLVIKTYFTGMRGAAQTFKNAKGLYWYNRYMPIFESLINIAASILLVKIMGVSGVILGTIISTLATCAWIEPWVLYKYGFNKSPKGYFIKYLRYLAVFAVILAVTRCAVIWIDGAGVVWFLVRLLISVLLPNILMLLTYRKTGDLGFMISQIKKALVRR